MSYVLTYVVNCLGWKGELNMVKVYNFLTCGKGLPPDSYYIGRTNTTYNLACSELANPYIVGRHGSRPNVLRLYRNYFVTTLVPRLGIIKMMDKYAGKSLVCWCAPSPCHGDFLVRVFNKPIFSSSPKCTYCRHQPVLQPSFDLNVGWDCVWWYCDDCGHSYAECWNTSLRQLRIKQEV